MDCFFPLEAADALRDVSNSSVLRSEVSRAAGCAMAALRMLDDAARNREHPAHDWARTCLARADFQLPMRNDS